MDVFSSLEEFYTGNERRRRSPEVDFGVHWRDAPDGSFGSIVAWPLWRVSWIEDTGELYAFRQRIDDGEVVVLLGVVRDREVLERTLAGWEELDWEDRTLDWVRRRLAGAASAEAEAEAAPVVAASSRSRPSVLSESPSLGAANGQTGRSRPTR